MTVSVVHATPDHLPSIERLMRGADRAEAAALGFSPADGLALSLRQSPLCWAGLVDGEPVCLFGVAQRGCLLSGRGEPWMLATDGIMTHQVAFLRQSRVYIPIMLSVFPSLVGMVHAVNRVSIRWLRWLGFAVGEPVPWGPFGAAFRPFTMAA